MENLKHLAKSNLKQSKTKTILTILTIVLTTCLLTAIGLICSNWGQVSAYTSGNIYGTHQVMFKQSIPDEIEKLATHLNVEKVQVVKTIGTNNDSVKNIGFSLQFNGVLNDQYITEVKLVEGAMPTKLNELVLSEGYMTALGEAEPAVGDTVTIKYTSRKDEVEKEASFVVSGIVETSADNLEMNRYFGLVSEAYFVANEFDENTSFTTYVNLKNGEYVDEYTMQEQVDEMTAAFEISAQNVVINTEYLKSLKVDPAIISGAVGIGVLIILSSMLVIYSIFYISIINKVQEYGKLRAIGATKKQIKKLILREGMYLAGIGIPIGLVLGYVVGELASRLAVIGTDVKTGAYNVPILMLAALASVFTVYISILRPMKIASTISPVDAMRYSGDSDATAKSRVGYDEMTPSRLSQANLKRNKKRTRITLLSLSISGILFIVASAILSSINTHEMTKHAFGEASMYVTLSNYMLESADNPEKVLSTIQQQNPLTESIEIFNQIEGVSDITIKESTAIKELQTEEWVDIVKLDPELNLNDYLLEGEIDHEKMNQENGIILDYPSFKEFYDLSIGDEITLEVDENGQKASKTFTIMAITENMMSSIFILPEQLYDETFSLDTTSKLNLIVDESNYEEVKKTVSSLVANEAFLEGVYYDEEHKLNESVVVMTKMMAYALVVVIGVIGFINLINTMITSIVVRKKEIGMLQAIGLTNKQFREMIQKEGFFYIGSAILISLVLGNIVGYVAVLIFKESGANYASYTFPLMQCLLLVVLTLSAQVVISYTITKNFNKDSLVDRIRYSE